MPTGLLVDDNDGVREVLRIHAEHRGLKVVGEAGDGRLAVALAQLLDPDAIILDHEMPGMSGLATLRLRRRRAPRSLVVICSSDPSIKKAALAAGARAYFTQGHSPRAVLISVVQLLTPNGGSDGGAEPAPGSFLSTTDGGDLGRRIDTIDAFAAIAYGARGSERDARGKRSRHRAGRLTRRGHRR